MRGYSSVGVVAFPIVVAGCLMASAAEMSVLPLPDDARCAGWAIAFSPDGRLLVASVRLEPSESNRIVVWDVATQQILTTIPVPGNRGGAVALAFSPDSRLLASAHGTGEIRLWTVNDWKPMELRGGTDPTPVGGCRVAFSPDGRWLAQGDGSSPPITVWDVASRRMQVSLKTGGDTWALRFLPDGKSLAVAVVFCAKRGRATQARGELQFWDIESGKRQRSVPGFGAWELPYKLRVSGRLGVAGYGMTLSSDARLVATSDWNRITVWDAATGRALPSGAHGVAVMKTVFSPDDSTLATTAEGYGTPNDSAAVMLWSTTTGRLIDSLKHPGRTWLIGLAFSADGKFVATTTNSHAPTEIPNRVYLWNLSSDGKKPSQSPSLNRRGQ